MTGLSDARESSIALLTKINLSRMGYKIDLLDGDEFRQHLCRKLGFSKASGMGNIRRLGFVGQLLATHEIISILSAINPYEESRFF